MCHTSKLNRQAQVRSLSLPPTWSSKFELNQYIRLVEKKVVCKFEEITCIQTSFATWQSLSACKASSCLCSQREHDSSWLILFQTLSALVSNFYLRTIQMKFLTRWGPRYFHASFQISLLGFHESCFNNQYAILIEKVLVLERDQEIESGLAEGIGGGTLTMCWIMSSVNHNLKNSRFHVPIFVTISLSLCSWFTFA